MQHLKLFLFTILLAEAAFPVQGRSTEDKLNIRQLSLVRKIINCGNLDISKEESIVPGPISKGVGINNSIQIGETKITGFGPDKEYKFSELAGALKNVTVESLTKALALDTTKKGAKTTDWKNVLAQLLLGYSLNPKNGIINYETAMMFAALFTEVAPETSAAVKTIIYVMMILKQQPNEGTSLSIENSIPQALLAFYGSGHYDGESTQTWIELVPFIAEVTKGNEDTAKKIASFLANKIEDFQKLRKYKGKNQLKVVQVFIGRIVVFAEGIQNITDT